MSVALTVSVVTAVVGGLIGYTATYFNNLWMAIRKDRVERLNAQLRDLYGPLVALLLSNHILYNTWRRMELPLPGGWKNSTEEERAQWRHWMKTVFMRRNREMLQVVEAHADLIADDQMPPVLAALCAHVEYYEALQLRWEMGEIERYIPYLVFPADVVESVVKSFNELKSKQKMLLDRPTPFRKRKRGETDSANYMKALEEYVKEHVRDAQIEPDSPFGQEGGLE